jgi:hypothetical protein
VAFDTAPANGVDVVIASDPAFTQNTSFENAGAFLPTVHDSAFDRSAIRSIYLKYQASRALKAPVGEAPIGDLPSATERANNVLMFDANGDPVVEALVVTTAEGSSVSTHALLAAISGPSANQSAILTEAGREGTFVFDASDLSAEVAADPLQGVYVPPSSDPTGASGAWVRATADVVEAIKFGVSAISTDNYAALGNAIVVARLLKKPLVLPAGTLIIDQAAPAFILNDDDEIIGAGKGLTTIHVTDTLNASAFIFSATGKSRIRFSGFKIEAASLRTSSNVCFDFTDCNDCLVEDVIMDKWTQGVRFYHDATDPTLPPMGTNLRNKAVRCISLSSRSYGFYMEHATACEFLHCEAYNVSNQDGFKTGGMTIFAKIIGCHAEGCAGDGFDTFDGFISSVISDCTSYNNTSNGFQFKGTFGGFLGLWDDYTTRGSVFSNLVAKGNGLDGIIFQEMRYGVATGLVCTSNGGNGITLNNIQGMSFSGCLANRNTKHGWSFPNTVSRCTFAACNAFDNSYADGTTQNGTYNGFNLAAASNCYLNGCYAENSTLTGHKGGQGYGFNLGTSSGNFFNGGGCGVNVTGAVGGTSPFVNNKFTAFDANATFIQSNYAIGYPSGVGIGGAVTQITNKSTGVTLNALTGAITMQASAALAAGAMVEFTVTNSLVGQRDVIVLNIGGGGTSGAYRYWISGVANGSFKICVENRTAGSLSEAPIFNFAVVKASNS